MTKYALPGMYNFTASVSAVFVWYVDYDSFNNENSLIAGHYNLNVLAKLLVEFTGKGMKCGCVDQDFMRRHLY